MTTIKGWFAGTIGKRQAIGGGRLATIKKGPESLPKTILVLNPLLIPHHETLNSTIPRPSDGITLIPPKPYFIFHFKTVEGNPFLRKAYT